MDPERRPEPFKTYSGSPQTIPLRWDLDRWLSDEPGAERSEFDKISRMLLLGAGAKRYRSPHLKGRYFRSYASAGALHPNELYVATADLEGVAGGLFHFDPRGRRLVRLGTGDSRQALSKAANDEEMATMSMVTVVTGIPWRTSWKYGPRGYRHLWWDAGMIIANFLALAEADNHLVKVACMFDDDVVNDLVGLDGQTEMALAIVGMETSKHEIGRPYSSAGLSADPQGPDPYEFPEITEVHATTSTGEGFSASKAMVPAAPPGPSAARTIWKRGSTREFDDESSISPAELNQILSYAAQPIPADWPVPTNELLLLVHSVDGYEPGAYRWDGSDLSQIRPDSEVRDAGYFLSLNQSLGSDGVATVFPMADLQKVAGVLGPRGYRAAQLEGAIRSGLIYLAAYGSGLGATGLTFFDKEVSKYFGVQTTPMLEVAIGTRVPLKPIKDPTGEPLNLTLADPTLEEGRPKGWRGRMRGYACEVEEATVVIRSISKRVAWGNVGQLIKADRYRGKSVRFTAEISTELPEESWAGLYVTVSSEHGVIAMDNMQDRPIQGLTDPESHSIEIRVADEADSISLGLLLVGAGEVRARAFQLAPQEPSREQRDP